ncbi:hypothetical protein D3C87_1662430 [compost metagenome]
MDCVADYLRPKFVDFFERFWLRDRLIYSKLCSRTPGKSYQRRHSVLHLCSCHLPRVCKDDIRGNLDSIVLCKAVEGRFGKARLVCTD